jgi:two-component sensor histidine kinase
MIQAIEMTGTQHPLSEAGLLLRELSHRINNEFASAIGIISVAAARCESGTAKAVLDAVQDRLHNYARVHHALQMPEYNILTDASPYLQRLCYAISRSKLETNGIELVFVSTPFRLSSECCWRLGLIVSELVTNAARHAFKDRQGTIRVEIVPSSSFVRCSVADDGAADVDSRPGCGLKIVRALAESLGGTIDHHFRPEGTVAVLTFPLSSAPIRDALAQPTSLPI